MHVKVLFQSHPEPMERSTRLVSLMGFIWIHMHMDVRRHSKSIDIVFHRHNKSISFPVVCPPGSYFQNGECTPCPHGSYQSQTGSPSCIKCPLGKTTVSTGAFTADHCKCYNHSTEDWLFVPVASLESSSFQCFKSGPPCVTFLYLAAPPSWKTTVCVASADLTAFQPRHSHLWHPHHQVKMPHMHCAQPTLA